MFFTSCSFEKICPDSPTPGEEIVGVRVRMMPVISCIRRSKGFWALYVCEFVSLKPQSMSVPSWLENE